MIDDYSDRHYPFEGCFNFRDIGGYLNHIVYKTPVEEMMAASVMFSMNGVDKTRFIEDVKAINLAHGPAHMLKNSKDFKD